MTSTGSDYAKLKILADLDNASKAKIWESKNGDWALYKYTAPISREYVALDFTRSKTFEKIHVLFKKATNDHDEGNVHFAKKARFDFALSALRGLSYHLHLIHGDRVDSGPFHPAAEFPGGPDIPLTKQDVAKRFAQIEHAVVLQARDVSYHRFPIRYTQFDFIPDAKVLNGGVCAGIATNWCLRFLFKGKRSYAVKKNGVALQTDDPAYKARMANRAPRIYHLQTSMGTKFGEMNVKGEENIGTAISAPMTTAEERLNLDALLKATPLYENADPINRVNQFINRQREEFRNCNIKKTYMDGWESGSKLDFYCTHGTDARLEKTIRTLFSNCSGSGKRAYVICFQCSETLDRRANRRSIPYFARQRSWAHAIAMHCSEDGRWGFMDPNFGEVHNLPNGELQDIFCDLLSYYSVTNHIWGIRLIEVSGKQNP